MKKKIFAALSLFLTFFLGTWAQSGHFSFEKQAYEHVIYAALTDGSGTLYDANQLGDGMYYLAAFVGDECRGEAQLTIPDPGSIPENPLFVLRVQGNNLSDVGKTITFRVFKTSMTAVGEAEYRIPSSTASLAYQADGTAGAPSNPYKIKFVPATSIALDNFTVEINNTTDLLGKVTTTPEGALLPYPINWTVSADYASVNSNQVLTAKKVTAAETVTLNAGTGFFALSANATMVITNPAIAFQWSDPQITNSDTDASKGTITIDIDDQKTLAAILDGGGYTLTGVDLNSPSTTTYSWSSNDQSIVGLDVASGIFTPKAVGTATLTGNPNDGSKTAPVLTVKVVQPVKGFTFGNKAEADTIVVVQVGDDLKARLTAMVNVSPANATNKNYTIDFSTTYFEEQKGKIIAKKSNCNGVSPIYLDDENVQSVTLTAADGFGYSQVLKVFIIPTQPQTIAPKEATLYMFTPETPPADISDQLYSNLVLTPNDLKISDYKPNLTSSNSAVVKANGEDGNGKQLFNLLKSGTSTMTVTLDVLDNLNVVTDKTAPKPTLTIYTKEISTSFVVEVHDDLSGFTFADVRTTVGNAVEITLSEEPKGVEFDPTKISVSVTSSAEMPTGWTFAEVTAKDGDKTGLKWIVTPKSVGMGTIKVTYIKNDVPKAMGNGTIHVDQKVTVKDGWQWISFFQGSVATKKDMQTLFADNLAEIRSVDAMVYNDVKYGYFGELNTLDTLKTYKLRMKDLSAATAYTIAENESSSSYFINNDNKDFSGAARGPLSIGTKKGWNWIGNPYQYAQKLTDIFGNTVFSEGDQIKGKTSFATYTSGQWVGELEYLSPGEGYLYYVAKAGQIDFVREFSLTQQTAPVSSAQRAQTSSPWTIDDSRFADNMSMIAHIGGLADASRLTLYAFVGDECRGRGIAVGDRQFITIHGERGERITFRVYDELTGQYYNVHGSRAFAVVGGTMEAPVSLYAGDATDIYEIENSTDFDNSPVYNLNGQRITKTQTQKGIYIQGGKKIMR